MTITGPSVASTAVRCAEFNRRSEAANWLTFVVAIIFFFRLRLRFGTGAVAMVAFNWFHKLAGARQDDIKPYFAFAGAICTWFFHVYIYCCDEFRVSTVMRE